MKNKKLVSIALCTYNGAKYLREQLDTLVNQTYDNIEIIAIDDCSSDNTFAILEEYAQQFTFLKIFKNEINLGYIKNFEKAILLCKGDYIALSDQDDIWSLEKIKLQVEGIGDNMLIYHNSEFIAADGSSINKKMSDILNMYEGDNFKSFLFFNCVSGHATLMKKELIKYSLPLPENIFHDRWFAFAATNLGGVKYINETLVKYRQHAESDTNILKLDQPKRKDIELSTKEKMKHSVDDLISLRSFKHHTNNVFIDKLIKLYKAKESRWICVSLIIFLYKNYTSLLYVSKKSTLSKLNFIFKNIWGGRIKSYLR